MISKYYKQEKFFSQDGGETWTSMGVYQKGAIIEVGSADCLPTIIYRWVNSGTTCSGASAYDKYYLQVLQQSSDRGETWTVVEPVQTRLGDLIERNSEDCGYTPPPPSITYYATEKLYVNFTAFTPTASAETFSNGVGKIEFASDVTAIGPSAFDSKSGLTSIDIPDSVTSIGVKAFQQCVSLTSVTIPSSVTSIGTNVFRMCDSLTSIKVNSNNSTYDSRNNCNAIIRTADNKLIQGCKTTVIPNTVTSIGSNAFAYCTSLTSITIPYSVTSIDNTQAFRNCTSLTSVTIPSSVTSIGTFAFADCSSLTSVTIGSGVTSIGGNAFLRCSGLTSISLEAITPPSLYSQAFDYTNDCPIYVPCQSVDTYKTESVWSTYASRITCVSPPSYSGQYLTFVAQESGTFTFTPTSSNTISYSLNSGSTWTQGNSVSVNNGQKVMWKGTMTPSTSGQYGIGTFSSSGNFIAEGNPMSLLFGDNFVGVTDLTGNDDAFRSLFDSCSGITSAENLSLPATTLANRCYASMFNGCTSLTTAPELPATTLNGWGCYAWMFYGCSSLRTAPQLPATTLSTACYQYMFGNCSALTTAPSLPATTLATQCYGDMFNGCISLTTAPQLPATTLSTACYYDMFYDCTSLTTAPSLPATTLATQCYNSMFDGCTSLTTAPELLATTLEYGCYSAMFYGCASLNYIKCLATDISASYCTDVWVDGVASSGTFVKATSMTSWTRGVDGIPDNWTIVNA